MTAELMRFFFRLPVFPHSGAQSSILAQLASSLHFADEVKQGVKYAYRQSKMV